MDNENYSDELIGAILKATKTIAVVGASPERNRPSYSVMQFLQKRGFRIVPVNPRAVGETILGEKVYASLADIPFPVDMVDIFRTSDAAGQVTDEAIAIKAKSVWMQLGVRNPAAAARAPHRHPAARRALPRQARRTGANPRNRPRGARGARLVLLARQRPRTQKRN